MRLLTRFYKPIPVRQTGLYFADGFVGPLTDL